MKITVHRGIAQIGGCITEIESMSGTRIVIDFGHNLPDGGHPSEDEFASEEAASRLLDGVSAVFYTHNHGDHVELFEFVPDDVRQFIGPLARKLMIAKLEHMEYVEELKAKCVARIAQLDGFGTYVPGESITIGDIEVTPYSVNHSATDSYMLVVRCDGKTVLHTGDYREHGYEGGMIFDAIRANRLAGNVDVLITEGTSLGQDDRKVMPEAALKFRYDKLMNSYKNVFILGSSSDADRLETIYSAHHNHMNKPLVVDAYQKSILGIIDNHWKGIGYHYHFNLDKVYDFGKGNVKLVEWMKREGFVMMIRQSEKFQDILDFVFPFCRPEETCLIYSQYRGYIIPGCVGYNAKAGKFVRQFPHFRYCHTSGHASRDTLVKLCGMLSPRSAIIPIHKDADSDLRSILGDTHVSSRVMDSSGTVDGIEIIAK